MRKEKITKEFGGNRNAVAPIFIRNLCWNHLPVQHKKKKWSRESVEWEEKKGIEEKTCLTSFYPPFIHIFSYPAIEVLSCLLFSFISALWIKRKLTQTISNIKHKKKKCYKNCNYHYFYLFFCSLRGNFPRKKCKIMKKIV